MWFIFLACLGGGVRYIQGVRTGEESFKWLNLTAELFISGFVGLVTMYVCIEMNFSQPVTAILVAISGHMGGKAITVIKDFVLKRTDIK